MTSRERLKRTLNHKEADRIPCHMNAVSWAKEKLKQVLGLSSDRELLETLHIDTYDMRGLDLKGGVMPKYIGPPHPLLTDQWSGNILDIWGIEEKVVETASGYMYSQEYYPLKEASSLQELKAYPWPDPDWFDFSSLRERLLPWADQSIIATGGSVWQHPSYLRSLDVLMIDMALQPEMAHYVFDRFTEFYLEFFKRILDTAGDLIDSFALADDLGMQNGLMISDEMFEIFVAPRLKQCADLAHSYDCSLILHSDGNIRSIIPRLIELGVDVLDPLQPEARNMDPFEIKREYGKDLVLRGGISTQRTLASGSTEEVAEEVKRVIDILGKDGGYICSPGHPVLQTDVPAENIITMYETAFSYGKYGSGS